MWPWHLPKLHRYAREFIRAGSLQQDRVDVINAFSGPPSFAETEQEIVADAEKGLRGGSGMVAGGIADFHRVHLPRFVRFAFDAKDRR